MMHKSHMHGASYMRPCFVEEVLSIVDEGGLRDTTCVGQSVITHKETCMTRTGTRTDDS